MLHIIRPRDIESVAGLKQTRIRELEARGDFPQRVRLSDRAVGWRSDEVEAWIESRPRAEDVPADSTIRAGIGSTHTGATTQSAAARAEREQGDAA